MLNSSESNPPAIPEEEGHHKYERPRLIQSSSQKVDRIPEGSLPSTLDPQNRGGNPEAAKLAKKGAANQEASKILSKAPKKAFKKTKKKKNKKKKVGKKHKHGKDCCAHKHKAENATKDHTDDPKNPEIDQKVPKKGSEAEDAKSSESTKNLTYSQKINSLKFANPLKNLFLVTSIILTLTAFGYNDIIGNVLVGPMTKYIYNLNREQGIKQTGVYYVCLSVGSIIANGSISIFANYIGRIKGLLLIEIMKLVAYFVITVENLRVYMGMVLVVGFLGTVQESLVMIIMRELLPPKISDKSGFLFYIIAGLFSTLASFMGVFYDSNEELARNWRVVMCWPAVVSVFSVLGVILVLGCLETPQYYVENVKDALELKKKMKYVAGKIYNKKSSEKFVKYKLYEIRKRQKFELKKKKKEAMKELEGAPKRKTSEKGSKSWTEIFKSRNLTQTILGTSLSLLKELAGISVISYFSTQMFDETMNGEGAIVTVVMNFTYLVGAVFSYWSINLGRRGGLLYTSIAYSISLLGIIVGVIYQNLPLVLLGSSTMNIAYTCGPGSILRVYMVEILDPNGIAIANTLKWLLITLMCALAPIMQLEYGVLPILEFHFIFSVVACIVIYLCVFETDGMSNEEVEIIFQRQKSCFNFGKIQGNEGSRSPSEDGAARKEMDRLLATHDHHHKHHHHHHDCKKGHDTARSHLVDDVESEGCC